MSAAGFTDPRLSQHDARGNPQLRLAATAIEAARIQPGAGLTSSGHFGGNAVSVKRQRRTAGSSERWPFQGYRSPYTGGGDPPDDQPFRVRSRAGTANTFAPSNIDAEFTCDASATIFFWLEGTFNAAGVLTSLLIDHGDSIPTDPAGAPNVAPAHSYRGIFVVTTDDKGITDISPLRKNSLDVTAVVVAVSCSQNTLAYQWNG